MIEPDVIDPADWSGMGDRATADVGSTVTRVTMLSEVGNVSKIEV